MQHHHTHPHLPCSKSHICKAALHLASVIHIDHDAASELGVAYLEEILPSCGISVDGRKRHTDSAERGTAASGHSKSIFKCHFCTLLLLPFILSCPPDQLHAQIDAPALRLSVIEFLFSLKNTEYKIEP